MIKKIFDSYKDSSKLFYIIFISWGVLVTGTAVFNIDNNLSFARYDTMDWSYSINSEELIPPKIIAIDNQHGASFFKISNNNDAIMIGSNNNSSISNNENLNSLTDNLGFRQDINGLYTNPKYGITEFEIPTGWFATESMNGDNGIILTMHPGTTEEFFTNLNSLANNETLPIMHLIVQDKEDLKERQMPSLYATESSLSTECSELNSNSTSTINDKQFQISTLKCSTTDNEPTPDGIDFGNDEITKTYKFDSPTTIYILQLILSSEYSSNNKLNDAYLSKFQPIIDDAISTLKIG